MARLGACTYLRKASINFIISFVLPSVRIEFCSRCKDFHEISFWGIFRKSVEKIRVSLKSDKNNGYFT